MDIRDTENYLDYTDYEDIYEKIREQLISNDNEKLLELWNNCMVVENLDSEEIQIGYYGKKPIKKADKETLWLMFDKVVGYRNKFRIVRRRNTGSKPKNPTVNKNIKTLKFMSVSIVFAMFAFAIAVITFNYIGNRNFRETFYTVSSLKVDSSIRIVQISDLHSCSYGKNNSNLTKRVGNLRPDIILLTGDIVDSERLKIDEISKMCAELAKIAPAYYIYGNNEAKIVYDFPLLEKALDKKFGFNDSNRNEDAIRKYADNLEKTLEKTGVKVLKNEVDTISIGATNVDIYGVLNSNPSSFWTYTAKSFSDYTYENPNNLKITAIHEPYIFEEFESDSWGDLIVCGHTHGGTVRVPVIGPLYTHEGGLLPERKDHLVYGRYDTSGTPVIVSSGLENSGILRINNQPELVVIDMNKF